MRKKYLHFLGVSRILHPSPLLATYQHPPHPNMNTATTNATTTTDYITVAIIFFRACGPATAPELQRELRHQLGANDEVAAAAAAVAIRHGLSTGWLEQYDSDSYW